MEIEWIETMWQLIICDSGCTREPVTSSLHLSDGCGGIQHLALAVTASEVLQNLLAAIL